MGSFTISITVSRGIQCIELQLTVNAHGIIELRQKSSSFCNDLLRSDIKELNKILNHFLLACSFELKLLILCRFRTLIFQVIWRLATGQERLVGSE